MRMSPHEALGFLVGAEDDGPSHRTPLPKGEAPDTWKLNRFRNSNTGKLAGCGANTLHVNHILYLSVGRSIGSTNNEGQSEAKRVSLTW